MYDLLVVMQLVRANTSPPLLGVLRKKIVSGWTAHVWPTCSSGSAKIGRLGMGQWLHFTQGRRIVE